LANTREIRRRIKSVKNTQQITKAMQMVAASKMRRAQQAALAGREYAGLLNRVLVSLSERVESGSHPLLAERPFKRELVLLVSTDKGLCGALNSNLFREAARLDPAATAFEVTGRKGAQFVARTRRELLADFHLPDNPTLAQTRQMSRFALDRFLSGEVDKVTVAFTRFINTLTQKPTLQTLLPIAPGSLGKDATVTDEMVAKYPSADPKNRFGYIFEPGPTGVLDAILPEYVHFQVYQMILDSRASEHSARMVAMKNATDNAKQIIKDLTLEYNKVRQAAITTELLEITTAQMAMA
jgi:F-type H+-transporting ATPase subunit gamma